MNFSQALEELKKGLSVFRTGWNGKAAGKRQFLTLQRPDEHSKMTLPYIFITVLSATFSDTEENISEIRVPWLASQTDLLSEDWEIEK